MVRESQRTRAAEFLHRMGSHHGVLRMLMPTADDIVPERIKPTLRFCESPDDMDLFEYCRLSQSVPSGRRIGRQVRILVFDEGQDRNPMVMGALGLASPTYALACRDSFLAWSGTEARRRKEVGLRRVMDLHLSVALYPYSAMLAGKLLAALAATETVARAVFRKYADPLLALTTSCSSGLHCPIYNRISLREGGLYRRIGATSGYTLSWMSPETLQLARRLDPSGIGGTPHSILAFEQKPLVVVRRALKKVGLPFESLLRLGVEKGVYFASVADGGAEHLRAGTDRVDGGLLSTAEVVAYWRDKLLPRRRLPIPSSRPWEGCS
jgi:hypothetical protein